MIIKVMNDKKQTQYVIEPLRLDGIDNERPIIISGPCSAESEAQMLATAHGVAKTGVKIFRAGIWKPRTRPGGFEGVGAPGLAWLQKVKQETGMLVTTEVANRVHVQAALEAGIDLLWVGARTSANPFAVQEIADALRSTPDVPVLVKNPVNPDLELWIGALQRLYNAGIHRLGAIHRGFSAYGQHLYRNDPQWHIPIELHRRLHGLTILCDPSHMGGKRELIAPLSQQALDMGFDGLMIESHCDPDGALSDKNQQITPESLSVILTSLVKRDTHQSTESLSLLRRRIDRCDTELLELLNRRMRVCREIGLFKKEHNMQVVQAQRYDDIMRERCDQARELGMSPDFMGVVMQAIHEESVRQQIEVFSVDELK